MQIGRFDEEIRTVRVPIKNAKLPNGHEFQDMQMLSIASLLRYLFDTVGLSICPTKVRAFWQHHADVGSPFMAEIGDMSYNTVPLGLFGDSARARQIAFCPPEKVVGIFCNLPLWRPRSSRHSRFLLFAVEEDLCYGRRTLNAIYREIVSELNSLRHGRTLGGEQATKRGLKFALAEHRGDWSYFRMLLGFRSSWTGGAKVPVCFLCSAFGKGPPDQQYYHVGPDAYCWTTEWDRAGFLANQMPNSEICALACARVCNCVKHDVSAKVH